MKKKEPTPLEVISYLSQMHQQYKKQFIVKDDWEYADKIYYLLLRAYHIYSGIKKDYRKKSPN